MAQSTVASWVNKAPSDMTNDELAEAKRIVADQLGPTQERLNTLSAAVGQLDWEINYRFRMAGTAQQPNNALPAYPLDAVASEFGDAPADNATQ